MSTSFRTKRRKLIQIHEGDVVEHSGRWWVVSRTRPEDTGRIRLDLHSIDGRATGARVGTPGDNLLIRF
ncbi:hypothetical protein SAMN05192558_113133 [Actinokineospora alba]|uniref:Uncharacterized protein n=1 Tax=Actinokineospora alba TaxID=504798 RepID=A0A1H0VAU4_9PSEU|nr:hypothetical protein [Actinokineospora alba]TDP65580.1 hypothetical protein C8E96_1066 [Actinokineospora alba]SDH65944.1 hypothetical protein SAMN05421871_101887 [Actinokineospora alba]SDP75355.1 hypothetical protein SAMN05192558_113133 [Actinokineospora alba]